jgi:hypothetical protein
MGKQEELIKIDRIIKDSEIRLKTFKVNADTIQKEIDFISNVESQLNDNIAYLKKVKIVALAAEYKKAKEDLKKTKNRLLQLKSDKAINDKAHKETTAFIEKSKETYDKLTKQNENNVLQGKFGKNRV